MEDCNSIVCVKYVHILSYIVIHAIKKCDITFLVYGTGLSSPGSGSGGIKH